MKKANVENIVKAIPDLFKSLLSYTKDHFDKNGQEALANANGAVGVLIKMFGQQAIDAYFDAKHQEKLADFGFQVYVCAGFAQARDSLESIAAELELPQMQKADAIVAVTLESLKRQVDDFNPEKVLVVFQPQYHPGVEYSKNCFIDILRNVGVSQMLINKFKKQFNHGIKSRVQQSFGDSYEAHLEEIREYQLAEDETRLLWDTVALGRIGLQEDEDLKYEPTFAQWQPVSALRDGPDDISVHLDAPPFPVSGSVNLDKLQEAEEALKPITELITEYFSKDPENHLEKVLFVVADFGKGKSVFLRHHAAELARQYLATGEGDFPIYFNLRNFSAYDKGSRLGVIGDYLASKYGIKIEDDYYKSKRYVFLVDSLDESGELNKYAVDRVIGSVKQVQNLDKATYRTNRIIITTRPFDDGLKEQLRGHRPQVFDNEEGRPVEHFISIYGFKSEQFNDWLSNALSGVGDLTQISHGNGIGAEILAAVQQNKVFDVHKQLLENQTLSVGELRRPIFAYMIFQLIIKHVDFQRIGKIGVYLSFLNLLTKEAKHIKDINYHINLEEEFKFRNVLHATAALWMLQRQQNKQGTLKKADICRVLESKNSDESDTEILSRFEKDKAVTDIHFLSHSYFGENDDLLHFQHQSFAEILLAEYYLKVFICFALEQKVDIEGARAKLILGDPTEQTMLFLKELLKLLKETAVKDATEEVLEKRKLLFPLMASLATKEQNTLFSNFLSYRWYLDCCEIAENQTEYPIAALEHWCIDQAALDKIVGLAVEILESKDNLVFSKADIKTALFDKELLVFQNIGVNEIPPDMDRWVALLVGNALYNDEASHQFFNGQVKHFSTFFQMIRNFNHYMDQSAPTWAVNCFQGIDMRENEEVLIFNHTNFSGIDFSYSYLKRLFVQNSDFANVSLEHVCLKDVDFQFGFFSGAKVKVTKLFDNVTFTHAMPVPGSFLGTVLHNKIMHDHWIGIPGYLTKWNFSYLIRESSLLTALIEHSLKKKLCSIDDLMKCFVYESKKLEKKFVEYLHDVNENL